MSLPPVSASKMQKLDREKTVVNLYVAGHPIDEIWIPALQGRQIQVHPFSLRLRDSGAHGGLSGSLWRPSLLGKTGRYVLRESNKGRQNFQSFHGNRQIIMETFNNVINSGQLVLVDFFATWCQPCKAMHPILEQVKSVLGDRIRIIKVDVDKYGVTANQYRIQSVPTLMLFRNGEVLWRTSGVVDKAELLATLDPFLT